MFVVGAVYRLGWRIPRKTIVGCDIDVTQVSQCLWLVDRPGWQVPRKTIVGCDVTQVSQCLFVVFCLSCS